MPRKGFEKVRTGCITCKVRKVKCDEARPACRRCQTGARICGGYQAPPPGSFSWSSLLQARPSTIPFSESSNAELRTLDFFRCIVAPALTSPLGSSFWTHPVCQLAIQEPAARYAVLAISSLYEHFDPFVYDSSPSDGHSVAISYYNKAMRQVATSKHLDADATLLMSILFICIEFLRGNTSAAIEHCRHGINISGSLGHASSDMAAIINHLRIFPFFFGATLSDFPLLQSLNYPSHRIHSLSQAIETLDFLMSRSVAILRAFDPFRLGMVDMSEIPSSLILMQQDLSQELDMWRTEFFNFTEKLEPNDENRVHLRILEVRWHVCKIWLEISSHQDETYSDTFLDQFERIVELAREDATCSKPSGPGRPNIFKFEIGLAPLLYFVVIKCRYLKLRLETWSLLKIVGHARESSWDTNLLYSVAKRIIEREHGIELPPCIDKGWWENGCLDYTLPSNSQRVKDSYLEEETELHVDYDALRFIRRRIVFFLSHGRKVRDWISLPERI
ncbi:hypothetical protein F4678DRAFT_316865 [Xylaria arbuscula]|nr:hypothetical protein F4678DRAFT_316865 [Xylaria arbuscula]